MTTEKDIGTKFDGLPENMSVKDIALFLGVSKSTAYNIANSNSFPRLKTPGRRLVIVPKAGFINWYNENCVTASELK
jgi:predicted DNA-binding transcriptional regulator AlpA